MSYTWLLFPVCHTSLVTLEESIPRIIKGVDTAIIKSVLHWELECDTLVIDLIKLEWIYTWAI